MRRGALVLAGALIAALPLSAAVAQVAPTVTIDGVSNDDAVSGGVGLRAEASSAAGIKKLELLIDDVVVAKQEPNDVKSTVRVEYDWDTSAALEGGGISRNGRYTVRAIATASGGATEKHSIDVIVDNPASAPTGVSASVADTNVSVTWNPNPEPDIVGYQLERDSGSGFELIATVGTNNFDEELEPGDHTYRVAAIRNSLVSNPGRVSAPAEAAPINVAPPPAPVADGPRGSDRMRGRTGGVPNPAFSARGRTLGLRGLSGWVALPSVELGSLPGLPSAEVPWGDYDEELPYEIPEGGTPLQAIRTSAAADRWTVIPPDGLRWVALGFLLLVAAALLRVVSIQLRKIAAP